MKFTKLLLFLIAIALITSTGCRSKRALKKAEAYFEVGEYYQAKQKYKKVSTKKMDKQQKTEINFKLGECSRHINEPVDAERYYRFAVKGKLDKPEATLYLADALKQNEKIDEALDFYTDYTKLVPNDQRGQIGIESCEKMNEWKSNSPNIIVENVKDFNSRENDFSLCYAKEDYSVVYFTSSREESNGNKVNGVSGMNFTDIFVSRKDRVGKWSIPVPLSDTLNSVFDEGATTMNSKYSTMYFTRCKVEKYGSTGCKIYKANRNENDWSAIEEVMILTDSSITVGHPTLSDDELTMYFVADLSSTERFRDKSVGGNDIWVVKRDKVTFPWGEPENIGNQINTTGQEMYPFWFNDTTLYFSSDYHLGMGGLDIFKATKGADGIWKVKNMGAPVNSTADDFGIVVEKEIDAGYFSSSRKGGKGGDDIYRFSMPPLKFTIAGIVKNEETGAAIEGAKVSMIGSNGTNFEKITEKDGAYKFDIKEGTDYILTSEKEMFFKGKGKETTKGLRESKDIKLDITMKAIPPVTEVTEIPNIEYEFGKWNLTVEAMVSLDKYVVDLLKENPNIAVELSSHTDFRGSAQFNDSLSQKRAQSVVDYLAKRMIDPGRLLARGFGEQRPNTVNQKLSTQYPFLPLNANLTEDFITNTLTTDEQREVAHQINRRTEFRVITTEYAPGMDLQKKLDEALQKQNK